MVKDIQSKRRWGRVRAKPLVVPWLQFLASWLQNEDRAKIQHVMDRAGAAVTKLVFGRWNEIFGEDTRGKEVIITCETVQGEKVDDKGVRTPTEEHDVYAKFQIRDGTRRFKGAMMIAVGQKFEHQTISLDGGTFRDCEFENCVLLYSAALPVILDGSSFKESRWEFVGPAAASVSFMRFLLSARWTLSKRFSRMCAVEIYWALHKS